MLRVQKTGMVHTRLKVGFSVCMLRAYCKTCSSDYMASVNEISERGYSCALRGNTFLPDIRGLDDRFQGANCEIQHKHMFNVGGKYV